MNIHRATAVVGAAAGAAIALALTACGTGFEAVTDAGSSGQGPEADGAIPADAAVPATWTQTTGIGDERFRAVWGSSPNDVYLVGSGGSVVRSANGGGDWTPIDSGTTETLNAIFGTSADDVYVVGDAGTILHSTGHGASFTPVGQIEPAYDITAVWASGPDDVWIAAGYAVYRSTDRGASWPRVHDRNDRAIYGLWGRSPTEILVGGGRFGDDYAAFVMRGDPGDGAVDWRDAAFEDSDGLALVTFVSFAGRGSTVFAVGSGNVYGRAARSLDGGATWTLLPRLPSSANTVWLDPDGDVLVVGSDNIILRTEDQGETWIDETPVEIATEGGSLRGIWGSGPQDVYVVGGAPGSVLRYR